MGEHMIDQMQRSLIHTLGRAETPTRSAWRELGCGGPVDHRLLTAARHDVTSFGCSPENEYTYWDGCLIETLPTLTKWQDLAAKVVSCIVRKEGGSTASFPQTFIGDAVKDLALPR